MKRYGGYILSWLVGVMPLAAEAQTEWQDPRQTDSHRELPGSPIRSYDSRELALSEDDAHSLYIQNLDGE